MGSAHSMNDARHDNVGQRGVYHKRIVAGGPLAPRSSWFKSIRRSRNNPKNEVQGSHSTNDSRPRNRARTMSMLDIPCQTLNERHHRLAVLYTEMDLLLKTGNYQNLGSNLTTEPMLYPHYSTSRAVRVKVIGFPSQYTFDDDLDGNGIPDVMQLAISKEEARKFIDLNFYSPLRPIPLSVRKKTQSRFFDATIMCIEEMQVHWFVMFEELNLFASFKITGEKLREFFLSVFNSYRDNYYHNFEHCMEVTQFIYYCFRTSPSFASQLGINSVLGCLISGLCHDLDHPGVTNDFLVKTRDRIAVLYNDYAVNENAHASALIMMLKHHPEADILSELSVKDNSAVRRVIITTILATNMDGHFAFMKEVETCPTLDLSDPTAEVDPDPACMLPRLLIKCADLSSLSLPFKRAMKWAKRLFEEFCEQGDDEIKMGFDPAPLFRRGTNHTITNHFFYEKVGLPLFEQFGRILPVFKEVIVDGVAQNVKTLELELKLIQSEVHNQEVKPNASDVSVITEVPENGSNEDSETTKESINTTNTLQISVYPKTSSIKPDSYAVNHVKPSPEKTEVETEWLEAAKLRWTSPDNKLNSLPAEEVFDDSDQSESEVDMKDVHKDATSSNTRRRSSIVISHQNVLEQRRTSKMF